MNTVLLNRLRRMGLPDVAAALTDIALPSIRIETSAIGPYAPSPIGASRIGGRPDFPHPDWPMALDHPLVFIAQFNMAEVAPFDPEHALPDSGMLYFFLYPDRDAPHHPDLRGGEGDLYVIYHDTGVDELTRLPIPRDQSPARMYNPCAVRFVREMTLPTWLYYVGLYYDDIHDFHVAQHIQQVPALRDLPSRERTLFKNALTASHNDGNELIRLLGYPDELQNDLSFGPDNDPSWRLLFQLGSVGPARMLWGDAGLLYFLIRRQDLAARDFARVSLSMQCS